VVALIEEALQNPVMSAPDGLKTERQESRSVCSKNIHHQSDLILRQLLTDFVTVLKSVLFYSIHLSSTINTVKESVITLFANIIN